MTGLLLLSTLLAAHDGGVSSTHTARPAVRADAGTSSRAVDAGTPHATMQHAAADAGPAVRDGGARTTAIDGAPQPATHIAVQEPAAPDAGTSSRKKFRADRSDGDSDPTTDALLEQSRAQTEALQQIAAQQRATEEARIADQQARIADQQARTQRAQQIDSARYSIDDTVQSIQANGNWDAASLQSTRQSLQQTAAAASAANSPAEASRASQAARLVEAAEAALAQKNGQQAQYYLMQANQVLGSAPGGVGY
jgi:hypothetical protein